jgi:large-conductance mechanosensitive channel
MQTLLNINPFVQIANITSPFFLFLTKFNIIPLAFSLIISLNLNQLSNSFIEAIISPVINRLLNNNEIKLKDRKLTILGITFEYGPFLLNLLQFIFTLIILFSLYLLYTHISSNNIDITNKSQPTISANNQN